VNTLSAGISPRISRVGLLSACLAAAFLGVACSTEARSEPTPVPGPTATAAASATLAPSATLRPTPLPENDPVDLARAASVVRKFIAYAENIGTDGSTISYVQAQSTLKRMYALADTESTWAFQEARLSALKSDALKDAIATVLSIQDVMKGSKADATGGFLLAITIDTYLKRLRDDLITLE
jgi:hypothetical protein